MVKLVETDIDSYVASLQQDGQSLIFSQDIWWRQVRPFFFRPLLGFLSCGEAKVAPCWQARLGGFQYPVDVDSAKNSRLGFLVFRCPGDYTLDSLRGSRRWEVRNAAKRFELRAFGSAEEFAELAHPVYRDFQTRTHYGYRSDRRQYEHFMTWSRQMWQSGGSNIWGAFEGDQLEGVGVFRLAQGTLFYSSFFGRTTGIKNHVAGFMLHRIREAAARYPGISRIVVGSPKLDQASRTVDQFYLSRGCDIEWVPARLELNPITRRLLRLAKPGLIAQLEGAEMTRDQQ